MRLVSLLAAAALCCNPATASTVVLTSSSTVVGTDRASSIFTLDTETADLTKVLDIGYPNENLGAYSTACVCGSYYHAVWTDPPAAYGIFTVDLAAAKLVSVDKTENLFHKMACDPESEGNLVGIASRTLGNGTFLLSRFDTTSRTDTLVANLPTVASNGLPLIFNGYDTIFQFDDEKKPTAVFAAFANTMALSSGGLAGGTLVALDLQSGEEVYEAQFPRGLQAPKPGQPFLVIPPPAQALGKSNVTMQGVISHTGSGNEIYWSEFTLPAANGDAMVDWQRKQEVDDILNGGSAPQVLCGGELISLVGASMSGGHSVSVVDPATGALVKAVRLEEQTDHNWGAIACQPSP